MPVWYYHYLYSFSTTSAASIMNLNAPAIESAIAETLSATTAPSIMNSNAHTIASAAKTLTTISLSKSFYTEDEVVALEPEAYWRTQISQS